MQIEDNVVVSLTYELRADDPQGEVVDRAEKDSPFSFLCGAGNVLPEFENNLKGLTEGDSFEFDLNDKEGYGSFNSDAVVELPKNIFVIEGELREDLLKEGEYVPMRDQEGNQLKGKVLNVGEETVKLDFNHPLAGKKLHFKGEVVNLRPATEEEVEHGHAHGAGGHQH